MPQPNGLFPFCSQAKTDDWRKRITKGLVPLRKDYTVNIQSTELHLEGYL